MTSFQLAYDAREDVLTASFGEPEEVASSHLPLNDHIDAWVSPDGQAIIGLVFRAYSRLLGVSETYFSLLRDASREEADAALALLAAPPACRFFDVTDPEELIARVLSPRLDDLFRDEEA